MADYFASTVDAAVESKQICGGAAIAVSKTGETLFSKAFGKTSLDANAAPWALDSTFWIASSSKLLTAVSVLQCVAKGLLKLDEDIGTVLPEFADIQVLTGFSGDGKPQLRPAETKPTLRHLLTHSSGLVYYMMGNSLLKRYRDSLNLPTDSGTYADYTQPLVFEPGTQWAYGPSIDWAGRMVEIVTALTLEEYEKKHIWEPLGMTQTTFRPIGNESIMSRMVGRVGRNAEGVLVKEETGGWLVRNKEANFGGGGLYSSAQDYIKALTSLLINDGKLLEGEMYEELFRGQLAADPAQVLRTMAHHPIAGNYLVPGYPQGNDTEFDHALGGAIVDKDIPGHAPKGTLFWSGLPNNYWFIDRKNGVCGFYASWIVPPGDVTTGKMFAALQQAAVKEGTKLRLGSQKL